MAARAAVHALVGLSLLMTALPATLAPVAADHGLPHDRECVKGSSGATFGDVTANGVSLQTQLGTNDILLPRGLLAAAISTTGNVTVEIHHKCVEAYHFVAEMDGIGTPVTTVDAWAYPACASGTDTYDLPVGWDTGEYHLMLTWYGCDGSSGSEARVIRVVDPPLPL